MKLQFKKFKGLYRLLRFELPLAAGICVVMGQLFALSAFAPPFTIAAGFLSVFLISSSILVMNDFFDVETDRINSPDRPIPSNLISANEALVFSLCLASGGFLISYFLGTTALIICCFLFVTGYLYNRFFKKSGILGNLIVSFSVGMTFIYGGATVGFPFHKIVVFFAIIAH